MKTQTFLRGALLASFISLGFFVSAQTLYLPNAASLNSSNNAISIDVSPATGNDKLQINGGTHDAPTDPNQSATLYRSGLYSYTTFQGMTKSGDWRLNGTAKAWLSRGVNAAIRSRLHGVEGHSKPESVVWFGYNNPTSSVGGYFRCDIQSDMELASTPSNLNTFHPTYLAGTHSILDGTLNSSISQKEENQPLFVASALIAEDKFRSGTHRNLTHAGYFIGRVVIADDVNRGNGTGSQVSGIHNDYMLAVNGKIVSKELVCTESNWADYVFEKDYKLLTLADVETHISEFGHLPNVPSAEEVKEKGLSIKEITITQQEKIEELFLYMIEMEKKLELLQKENKQLKGRLN